MGNGFMIISKLLTAKHCGFAIDSILTHTVCVEAPDATA